MKVKQTLAGLILTLIGVFWHANIQAEVAFSSAMPNPASVNQQVTLIGTSDCQQVFIKHGDPASDMGQLVNVDSGTGNFSLQHAYPSSGTYTAEVFQLANANCTSPDIASGNNYITITVADKPITTGSAKAQATNKTFESTVLELSIQRVELYFDSGSAKIHIPFGETNLQINARIHYRGTGIVQAVWIVDGRRIEDVALHLNYGDSTTISSSKIPGLPSSIPGPHKIELAFINQPELTNHPTAIYFVESNLGEVRSPELLSPLNEAMLNEGDTQFQWSNEQTNARYRIDFYHNDPNTHGEQTPIFSAYSNTSDYTLDASTIAEFFTPGEDYWWQVDIDKSKLNQKPVFTKANRITVPHRPTQTPKQIIVAAPLTTALDNLLRHLPLKRLDAFELKSLGLIIHVYSTEENVPDLVNKIQQIANIKLAQPNFLFYTAEAEPLQGMQTNILPLPIQLIHNSVKGKKVRVAIIDSDIDSQHVDLKDRIIIKKNFVSDETSLGEIHGTAVAGILAASINNFGILGIAPEANLLALRACTQKHPTRSEAICNSASIIKALDYALTHNAHVVNMSFGTSETDALIDALLIEGQQRGVVFVAPIGNGRQQLLADFPARHALVLAVGGKDDLEQAYPSENLVEQADVVANATQLFTTVPNNRHNFVDGTSFATATVSGLVALAFDSQATGQRLQIPKYRGNLCTWFDELSHLNSCP